jgi:predicted outer membrane repeat protein
MKTGSHPFGVGISMALICAVLFVTSAHTAKAAGVVGTGTTASCTDAALATSLTGGGLVTFNCGGTATITVASPKSISADTTIDGEGLITISGGNSVDVFRVSTAVEFTVQNLTIANGYNAHLGGGIYSSGTLTVINSTFADNYAEISGGGIENAGGTLTVTNSIFSRNSAYADGGGIENTGGRLTVISSTFSGSDAADGNGGSIYSSGPLTVRDSTFSRNGAGTNGGAIYSSSGLTVINSTFGDNAAASQGGAIYSSGLLTVINSTFSGNAVSYGGGGIFNDSSTATVTSSTFSGNSADDCGNDAADGGGIYSSGTLTVTNSTFSGNDATSDGGGIFNLGTLTVTNSTFSGNSVDEGNGGGIYSYGTLTVTNSIVANSTSGGNCYGAVTDGGHNIDDGTTCGFTGTSLSNMNPMLAALANNGGPTQTIALCTGTGAPSAGCTGASPAIDGGDESVCSTTTGPAPVDNLDQRGFIRPGTASANCSIGAFEANSPGPPPACVGDCNGDGRVTVDELITLILVPLTPVDIDRCPAGETNGDRTITIDELVGAVNAALSGCRDSGSAPALVRPEIPEQLMRQVAEYVGCSDTPYRFEPTAICCGECSSGHHSDVLLAGYSTHSQALEAFGEKTPEEVESLLDGGIFRIHTRPGPLGGLDRRWKWLSGCWMIRGWAFDDTHFLYAVPPQFLVETIVDAASQIDLFSRCLEAEEG